MKYVVTRIARDNPDIKGRRLYLTNTGLWSLYLGHALRFASLPKLKLKPRATCGPK